MPTDDTDLKIGPDGEFELVDGTEALRKAVLASLKRATKTVTCSDCERALTPEDESALRLCFRIPERSTVDEYRCGCKHDTVAMKATLWDSIKGVELETTVAAADVRSLEIRRRRTP